MSTAALEQIIELTGTVMGSGLRSVAIANPEQMIRSHVEMAYYLRREILAIEAYRR